MPSRGARQARPFAEREVYADSDLLSKFMIAYFSKVMSNQLGGRDMVDRGGLRCMEGVFCGLRTFTTATACLTHIAEQTAAWYIFTAGQPYDGSTRDLWSCPVRSCGATTARNSNKQSAGVLESLLPPQAPANFRRWFPHNKRNAEFNVSMFQSCNTFVFLMCDV